MAFPESTHTKVLTAASPSKSRIRQWPLSWKSWTVAGVDPYVPSRLIVFIVNCCAVAVSAFSVIVVLLSVLPLPRWCLWLCSSISTWIFLPSLLLTAVVMGSSRLRLASVPVERCCYFMVSLAWACCWLLCVPALWLLSGHTQASHCCPCLLCSENIISVKTWIIFPNRLLDIFWQHSYFFKWYFYLDKSEICMMNFQVFLI